MEPVIYEEASDDKKRAEAATSWGVQNLFKGTFSNSFL